MKSAIFVRTKQSKLSVLALSFVLIGGQHNLSAASVEGESEVQYPVTLTFAGKEAGETEATFRDHGLDGTFRKGDKSFWVPGCSAADDNAAKSSAINGKKWRVRVPPNALVFPSASLLSFTPDPSRPVATRLIQSAPTAG
ncbi:MAG: hypothetical protein ABFE13_06385 [Phycisphaerales bacterium]